MTKAGAFTAEAVEQLVKDKDTLAKAYDQLLASNKRLRAKLRAEGRYV